MGNHKYYPFKGSALESTSNVCGNLATPSRKSKLKCEKQIPSGGSKIKMPKIGGGGERARNTSADAKRGHYIRHTAFRRIDLEFT